MEEKILVRMDRLKMTEYAPDALINVPDAIRHVRDAGQENLSERPIYFEKFEDGSGFVFNPENPSGVKYLARHAFSVYRSFIENTGRPPVVDVTNGPLYADFVRHGIAKALIQPNVNRRGKPAPRQFTVWFHISNACNLACRYCYIPKLEKAVDIESMSEHFMTPATMEVATDSLFEFCLDNGFAALQIKFAGGEPTLNVQQIRRSCEYAKRMADKYKITVTFSMLSNGVFVDNEIFELIVENRIAISISMDGDARTHDEMRFTIPRSRQKKDRSTVKRDGTWQTIERNIDELISRGVKPFILCTVTEKNYRCLNELLTYTASKKIGLRFSLVRDFNSHLRPGLEAAILDALESAYRWLGEFMPTDMPIERYAQFAEWRPSLKKVSVCGTCRSTAAIDQQGNVASCQMRLDRPKGSVHDAAFSTIFSEIQSAGENQYLRDPQAKTGDCSVCYWKYTCAGGCPEHTRMVKGSANAPSPWCHVYQKLLPYYFRAIAQQIKRSVEKS